MHSDKKIILIDETGYAGEIKKSVFSLLNIILLNQDILPMHCSANLDTIDNVYQESLAPS